jgi:hypothetical protein
MAFYITQGVCLLRSDFGLGSWSLRDDVVCSRLIAGYCTLPTVFGTRYDGVAGIKRRRDLYLLYVRRIRQGVRCENRITNISVCLRMSVIWTVSPLDELGLWTRIATTYTNPPFSVSLNLSHNLTCRPIHQVNDVSYSRNTDISRRGPCGHCLATMHTKPPF